MKPFDTTKFYLAAYLQMAGYEVEAEYRNQVKPNEATFVFPTLSVEQAEVLLQQFYQDQVLQEYIPSIQKLKKKLYKDKEPRVY